MDNNLVYCTRFFFSTFADITVLQYISHGCHSFAFLHMDNPILVYFTHLVRFNALNDITLSLLLFTYCHIDTTTVIFIY